MDFQARQQQALAILDRTGMQVRPPHFMGFWRDVSVAVYYAHGRRKYRLPSWESLGGR